MSTPNYDEFRDRPVGDNLLAQISQTALEQKRAEAEVARLQDELKKAQEHLQQIAEHELPELMDAAELTEFTTRDGIKITVRETVRGGVPVEKRARAFKWLEDHGHGNLIKRQFTIDFGRDQEDWAREFEETVLAREEAINYKLDRKVAPATLTAFVNEQLREGVDFPLEMFGIYRQRMAKVDIK